MRNNTRLVVVVVIILVAASAAFLAMETRPQPSPAPPAQPPLDTSSWQTYQDSQYSFRYPDSIHLGYVTPGFLRIEGSGNLPYQQYLMVSQLTTKDAKAMMRRLYEGGDSVATPVTIDGRSATVYAADLLRYPKPGTNFCLVGYEYFIPAGKDTYYQLTYNDSSDVGVGVDEADGVFKIDMAKCPIYKEPHYSQFLATRDAIIGSFRFKQ